MYPDATSFNSTLVRLKELGCVFEGVELDFGFNSTLVRLKVTVKTEPSHKKPLCFNSTLVRLKVGWHGHLPIRGILVSIPHWFD